MMKDVTLGSIIGLSEFMRTARTVVSRTFRPFEIYTFVPAVYAGLFGITRAYLKGTGAAAVSPGEKSRRGR